MLEIPKHTVFKGIDIYFASTWHYDYSRNLYFKSIKAQGKDLVQSSKLESK